MERPHPESMLTGSPVSLRAGDGEGLGGMREARAAPSIAGSPLGESESYPRDSQGAGLSQTHAQGACPIRGT